MNKIDLTTIVGSHVLCEFWNDHQEYRQTGFLTEIDGDEIPDSVYPVRIDGVTDLVKIEGDTISVNNLKPKRAILTNRIN